MKHLFVGRATVEAHWLRRTRPGGGPASCLLDAPTAARRPEGEYYAWVAYESFDAKTVRSAPLERGADRTALKPSGYWRRGSAATHDVHD